MLSKSICSERVSSDSLRVSNNLITSRFKTKFMNNSLEYRGSALWNLINDNKECGHLSLTVGFYKNAYATKITLKTITLK